MKGYGKQKMVTTVTDSEGKLSSQFTTYRTDFVEKLLAALPGGMKVSIEEIQKGGSLTIDLTVVGRKCKDCKFLNAKKCKDCKFLNAKSVCKLHNSEQLKDKPHSCIDFKPRRA